MVAHFEHPQLNILTVGLVSPQLDVLIQGFPVLGSALSFTHSTLAY